LYSHGADSKQEACMEDCRHGCWESKISSDGEKSPSFTQHCGKAGEECFHDCEDKSNVLAVRMDNGKCLPLCYNTCQEKADKAEIAERRLSKSSEGGSEDGGEKAAAEEDLAACNLACVPDCKSSSRLDKAEAEYQKCLADERCPDILSEQLKAFDVCIEEHGCPYGATAGTGSFVYHAILVLMPAAAFSLAAFKEVLRCPGFSKACESKSVAGRAFWVIGIGMTWLFVFTQLAAVHFRKSPVFPLFAIAHMGVFFMVPFVMLPAFCCLGFARCLLSSEADDADDSAL